MKSLFLIFKSRNRKWGKLSANAMSAHHAVATGTVGGIAPSADAAAMWSDDVKRAQIVVLVDQLATRHVDGKRTVVVLDSALIQHSIDTEKFHRRRCNHRLILLYLWSNSPELNRLEILWKQANSTGNNLPSGPPTACITNSVCSFSSMAVHLKFVTHDYLCHAKRQYPYQHQRQSSLEMRWHTESKAVEGRANTGGPTRIRVELKCAYDGLHMVRACCSRTGEGSVKQPFMIHHFRS